MATTKRLLPRKLRIFAAVYDTHSTTAAADMVGLTQSAVSKSIAQLEADLEIQLFERTLKGLRPLRTADALRSRTRWISRELEIADAELQSAAGLEDVVLSIGSGPVWNVKVLPQILPEYFLKHPDIRLDIVTGSGDHLVPRMLDGTYDFYFGVLYDELYRPGLYCEKLLEMELQVFVRDGHPILKRDRIQPQSLTSYPWIGFSSDDELEGKVTDWAKCIGFESRRFSLRVMSLAAMMAVARTSDHILFVTDALDEELQRNSLTRLPFDNGPGKVISGLAVRSSIAQLPPGKSLIELARRACAET